MSALFLQGNSRDVLKGLPADYFHCAMTSPPYFGLRKYQGGEEIWDGDSGCTHEWGVDLPCHHPGQVEQTKWKDAVASGYGQTQPSGNFCQLCGAWKGQLGNEPDPSSYIKHLVEICREVRRVLRLDGCFFLNIGDSWAGSGKGQMGDGSHAAKHGEKQHTNTGAIQGGLPKSITGNGIKPLDMVLIPEQLALALRADGWYLRSILIWAKGVSLSDEYNGNPMPESVNGWRWERCRVKVAPSPFPTTHGHHPGDGVNEWVGGSMGSGNHQAKWQDCPGCPKCEKHDGYVLRKGSWRPTDAFEQILMLTKTNSYFCDRESVLEHGVYPAGESRSGGNGHKSLDAGSRTTEGLHNKDWNGNGGRNLRSVLDVPIDLSDAVMRIPTTGFKGSHFAVFPPRLVEPLIKAATSEKGCCPKCGSPWVRVIDKQVGVSKDCPKTLDAHLARGGIGQPVGTVGKPGSGRVDGYTNTIGWLPTCTCGSQETEPCRILDPFSGAGTTALVAERLGLDSIGIDTSAEYIKLAEARIAEDEQKRIDEQIKQLRKEAKLAEKENR